MHRSLLLFGGLALGVSASPRCSTGDRCFPNSSVLAAFNSSIGGKLHSERPIGASCYPSDPLYNATACSEVKSKYGDDQWRSDLFGELVIRSPTYSKRRN